MLAVQRAYILLITGFVVTMMFGSWVYHSDGTVVIDRIIDSTCKSTSSSATSNLSKSELIAKLFEHLKHNITAPSYTFPDGEVYKGSENPTFTKPIGKRLLIVDIDTRAPTGKNQILNPERIDWENLHAEGGELVTNAILNHYLYALIHGYDYKYFQAQEMKDMYATWVRPHVLRKLLPDYDWVVTMDADVVVPHLEVGLEWMFNRWGVTEGASAVMAWDVEEWRDGGRSASTDSKGLLVWNGGFVVMHNTPNTFDMLEAWAECPTEKRYQGCGFWKDHWSHEQRAFAEYIRYDFNKTAETFALAPCDDVMGYPGFKEYATETVTFNDDISDCKGRFISHHTIGKQRVIADGGASVMQLLSAAIQKELQANSDKLWVKEPPVGQ